MFFIIKEGRRQRYIGFTISQTSGHVIEKDKMITTLRKQCQELYDKDCRAKGIYLTRFDGTQGIVKCKHIEKENTINLLKSIKKVDSISVQIETLGTSGTIKSLVKKHMT